MSSYVWVVIGSTGEYSDKTEWLVKVYDTEEEAEQETRRLNSLLEMLNAHSHQSFTVSNWHRERNRTMEILRQEDSGFELDYTGTNYEYVKVQRG